VTVLHDVRSVHVSVTRVFAALSFHARSSREPRSSLQCRNEIDLRCLFHEVLANRVFRRLILGFAVSYLADG
jgi:hypothetical protein